jgi:aldehyde:ferredoxin oxidoreductase
MSKIIRVDMTTKKISEEAVAEKYQHMGGRQITSQMIFDEVPPLCHPLGPNNKIVIAPGMVTGTASPSSGRLSVGGKSPLTGGIKEANAGTPFAQKMGRLGIKALVLEGRCMENTWMLKITKDGAELLPVEHLKGKGMYETADILYKDYPNGKHAIMGVGPAGEMKMARAGVAFSDTEGRPSRYSGRGGLGAVIGSKGLKAIVIDDTDAQGTEIVDLELFKTGRAKLTEAIRAHDLTKKDGALNTYGTAVLINLLNEAGGLPTNNFRSGVFEGASKISGEMIHQRVQERNAGMTGHGCHPGCIIRCSNVYPNADGTELVSCIEYESAWSLGANCGIDDLDVVGKLIHQCNDIGVDTIEAGVAIGVAMDAGVKAFGDGVGAIELMEEIRKGTPMGRILGNGAEFTGKAYGMTRIPTVKGQGMPAYEPRAVKGIAVTYATSPMGADHTAGYTIAPEIAGVGGKADPLSVEGKIDMSRTFQYVTGFVDASGYCLFIAFPIIDFPAGMEGMVESVNGVMGTKYTVEDVAKVGKEIVDLENEFNRRAGISKEHHMIPEFMRYEKLPPHNVVFDIPDEELQKIFD